MDRQLVQALRDAGLRGVCLYNGQYMWVDGRALSAHDLARVLEIARGAIGSPERPPSGETPTASISHDPPKKHAGGRPPGSKNKPKH